MGLSKHGFVKMPSNKAYVLVLGILNKDHCMTTCTEFEGETHRW